MQRIYLPGITKNIALLSAVMHEGDIKGCLAGPTLVMVDEALAHHAQTKTLIETMTQGRDVIIKSIPAGEHTKSLGYAEDFLEKLKAEQKPFSGMLAIGGGTLINLANYVAHEKTKNGEILPYYLLPSTILAVADVAYGSKGNLNSEGVKHKVRTYHDPDAIVFSPDLLETLPDAEIKRGLSECLKHAVLQDYAYPGCGKEWVSFDTVGLLMEQKHPDRALSYVQAFVTAFAKAQILQVDKMEKTPVGGLLSYGHLHAHALEMATDFSVHHGDSVVFGMLVDLKLAGNTDIYKKVLRLVPDLPLAKTMSEVFIDETKLKEAYKVETKPFFRVSPDDRNDNPQFYVLPLEIMGQYYKPEVAAVKPEIFSLDKILSAVKEVRLDIDREVNRSPVSSIKRRLRHAIQSVF